VHVRLAEPADLPGAHALLLANGLHAGEPEPPAHLEHVRSTGRLVVADDDGAIVGFAATIERGGATFLTDCFVDPARHGAGVGRRVLEAVLDGAGTAWTFASEDPAALPLYARAGMLPRAPVLWLELEADRARELLPRGVELEAVDAGDADVAALDREAFGRAREVDTAHWARDTAAGPHLLRRAGWPVAYAWVRPPSTLVRERAGRWEVGPAGGRTPAEATLALLAAVALAARQGRGVALNVIGPHPALPALLGAGARVVDRDIWLATSPVFDPTRYVPSLLHG
jgi:GNAT superfamily N-acetyltransferase